MSHSSKRICVRPTSTTTILDLNDDVLRETFRKLNPADLCAVADVCTFFKRNAQAEFALRYNDLDFDAVSDYCDDCDDYLDEYNLFGRLHPRQMAPAFRNFGSSFVSIYIDLPSALCDQSPQVVKLLIRYCGESLQEVNFGSINFTDSMIQQLRPLLSRLHKLELGSCSWTSESVVSEMFSFCTQLHTLSLSDPVGLRVPAAFSKLKSLAIYPTAIRSHQSIETFLALNPKIEMFECSWSTSEILPSIATFTPQIEKIKLTMDPDDGFVENAKHLKRLTALKSLDITCDGHSFASVLRELAAAHIPLECLNLLHLRWDQESVDEIMKFKQLKKLGWGRATDLKLADILMIARNLSELTQLGLADVPILLTDLPQIVRCGPKLRHLWFHESEDDSETMNKDLYMKNRDVVAKREEKFSLVLHYLDEPDIPEKLLKANRDVFKIEPTLLDW